MRENEGQPLRLRASAGCSITDDSSQPGAAIRRRDAHHAAEHLREVAGAGVADLQADLDEAARGFTDHLLRAGDAFACHDPPRAGSANAAHTVQATAAPRCRPAIHRRDSGEMRRHCCGSGFSCGRFIHAASKPCVQCPVWMHAPSIAQESRCHQASSSEPGEISKLVQEAHNEAAHADLEHAVHFALPGCRVRGGMRNVDLSASPLRAFHHTTKPIAAPDARRGLVAAS